MRLVVKYEAENAWLFLPEETLSLPRVPTASGVRYSDGKTSFWNKGESAILEWQGRIFADCKLDRRQSVWEDAKLRGVHFRALGNEPPWVVEIGPDGQINLSLGYDQQLLIFPAGAAYLSDSLNLTIYQTRNPDHQLKIEVKGSPCQDSMSGQTFSTSVKILLDDLVLEGCGQSLH